MVSDFSLSGVVEKAIKALRDVPQRDYELLVASADDPAITRDYLVLTIVGLITLVMDARRERDFARDQLQAIGRKGFWAAKSAISPRADNTP